MTNPIVLDCDQLTEALPDLSENLAGLMYEAIVMCLDYHNHLTGVPCDIRDLEKSLATAEIVWTKPLSGRTERSFGDARIAVELAAEGIACMTIRAITNYTVIERSIIGTGFDFWLGYKDATEDNLQRAARMEVKGRTRLATESQILSVVNKGLKQTRQSERTRLPVYVILTEFSRPIIYMVQP